MKQAFVIMACLIMALGAVAQEEVKIEITSFEDGQDWAYTGDSIYQSEVQTAGDVEPQDGDHMLFVEYDNFGGAWNWAQLDFQGESHDLTNMTEIHMWVYYNDLAPDLTIQLQASSFDPKYDINLGNQTIEKKEAWQEMVWKIDPITAQKLVNVDHFGGFIDPGQ
ncbi:hypothetical protein GF373_05485, partial [bacterium]|nr:hypothetical protein [bacterium]